MALNIKYYSLENFICVDTEHTEMLDLNSVENLYYKILCDIFLNKSVTLITKQPQEYSFGSGMEKSCKVKLNNLSVLINKIDNCNSDLLGLLSQDEEFRRGLLFIVEANEDLVKQEIEEILLAADNEGTRGSSSFTFSYCRNDGASICLYNTNINIERIMS